jgi:hypothetical protein
MTMLALVLAPVLGAFGADADVRSGARKPNIN